MHRLQREDGMALLLVLVVITLLASLLSEFAFSTLVDLRLTETFRDRTGSYYLARGGVEAGRIMLQVDNNAYDHPTELWGQGVANYPAGEGTVSIEIEDLSGRLNLNGIADSRGNPLPGFHRFVALCQEVLAMSATEVETLAVSLQDWQNADPQFASADDSYYQQQQPPYTRKAGALDAVEELNLIRGFDQQMVEALSPYVRVFGGNTLNINTAPAAMLYAWQASAAAGNVQLILEPADIESIVAYRDQQPFEVLGDIEKVGGSNPNWLSAWQNATVKGTVYRIRGEGQVNQGIRTAEAIVEKQGNRLLSYRVD